MLLQDQLISMASLSTSGDFLKEVVGFTRHLGFDTVTASTVIDHVCGEPEFITLDNAPAAYRDSYEDPAKGRRDPVMQHCKRSSLPIVWSQDTYTSALEGEKWEEQACFGYRTGIAIALHLPRGLHFCIGVDRDGPLPTDTAEVTRMTADLHLFAVFAHETAFRVMLPRPPQSEMPSLTPRELEGLRWTMEGKTAWELGRILGISEQTAVKHVNSAAHKLGCVSKHQAVLKALRLGLIH